ncbi:MAG: hypothetical protein ABI600_13350, partial [Luteolibacter sp.]
TVSTSPSYSFVVTANRNLVATFIEAFVISSHSSPAAGGAAEMDKATYQTNDKVNATATANNGYAFANWTEDGVVVSTDRSYGFKATGNRSLVANFIADFGCTITLDSKPAHGGSASGDDNYGYDDDVLISAIPSAGYGFVCWTQGGAVVSSVPNFSFTAQSSLALVANFAPLASIAATAVPAEGGQVTGAGDYAIGAAASLVPTANPGFAFIGWTENSTALNVPTSYGFTVQGARTLVASFIPIPQMAAVSGAPGSNSMEIAWPEASAGWELQESGDCQNWQPCVRPVVTGGGMKKVTVPTTGGTGFFRLVHP